MREKIPMLLGKRIALWISLLSPIYGKPLLTFPVTWLTPTASLWLGLSITSWQLSLTSSSCRHVGCTPYVSCATWGFLPEHHVSWESEWRGMSCRPLSQTGGSSSCAQCLALSGAHILSLKKWVPLPDNSLTKRRSWEMTFNITCFIVTKSTLMKCQVTLVWTCVFKINSVVTLKKGQFGSTNSCASRMSEDKKAVFAYRITLLSGSSFFFRME